MTSIADGMGNFSRNSLPACRLNDLLELLTNIFEKHIWANNQRDSQNRQVCFWLDTLCVPVKGNPGRKEALNTMRSSYTEARCVLVLDESLRHFSPASSLEAAVWIMRSPWTTRLWTLEEALLAHGIIFQFANRSYLLINIYESLRSSEYTIHPYCGALRSLLASIAAYESRRVHVNLKIDADSRTAFQYLSLLTSLRTRSTSRAEDEAFCLASVLDVPRDRIIECPAEQRMQELWLSPSKVPLALLFISVPRLSTNGLRWAPASLLCAARLKATGWSEELGAITPAGLTYKGPGFLVCSPQKSTEDKILLEVDNFEPIKPLPLLVTMVGEAEPGAGISDLHTEISTSLAILIRPETHKEVRFDLGWFVAILEVTYDSEGLIRGNHLRVYFASINNPEVPEQTMRVKGKYIETEWLVS